MAYSKIMDAILKFFAIRANLGRNETVKDMPREALPEHDNKIPDLKIESIQALFGTTQQGKPNNNGQNAHSQHA